MRRFFILAASSAVLLSQSPSFGADSPKGLMNRVGKVEESVFGAQHKDKPLHARISDLEQQAMGSSQSGPLSKRVESLETTIDGHSATPSTSTSPTPTAKAAPPAKFKSPVPTKTSDYMPPIAPQLDPGAKPSAAPDTTTAAGSDPSDVDQMLRNGTAAFQLGRTDEAEKTFRDVLAKSPFNSNACYNLGAIAEARGDLAGALGNYRTALIGSPNDAQIQQAIAQIEYQISQKQDSPFKNPLIGTKDGAPLLQGSASDFGLKSGAGAVGWQGQAAATNGNLQGQTGQQGPFNANATTNAPTVAAQPSRGRRAAQIGLLVGSAMARSAIRGAMNGNFNSPMGIAGSLLGGLHCPICRLIP